MNGLLSRYWSYCHSSTCISRRYYAKGYRKSGSSSRKLAKTLEPKESNQGHLEIAPKESKKSSSTSQSFTREEAPHTTRIPAPLWNKRRPVERLVRRSSDRRRESERSFRDRGRERDRVSERYSQEPSSRWSSNRHRESEESFRDRGRERGGVSERYSQEQTPRSSSNNRETEGSYRDRRREGDEVSERSSQERPSGSGQAGKKVAESNDTRYYAYKQYLERREFRLPDSPPHFKSGTPNVRTHNKETTTDEFHHPPDPVSLAPSSKGISKVLVPDAPFAEQFTSPPLLPGLLKSLKEIIGNDARPTPIQSLSLKWLLKHPDSAATQLPNVDTTPGQPWRQFLLASETGSGKSIAYLLPLLQNLKEAELMSSSRPPISKRPYNPRGLILAPTHELSRQLSGFAKSLLHEIKLRVLCVSQANQKSTTRRDLTSSKMSSKFSDTAGPLGEFDVSKSSHPVDILVGTPMKVLEMVHGRGWDKKGVEEAGDKEVQVEGEEAPKKLRRGRDKMVGFGKWRSKPELGLANIEWVVVDEADVLFDPDFQESTRTLLADISSARGHLLSVSPSSELSTVDPQTSTQLPTPVTPEPINYPFNLLLTSATIPNSLNIYLEKHHPSLIRLASPHLHHLPKTLQTEYVNWTGGNKFADVERRIRQVWAEDSANASLTSLSKILIFCNRSSKVMEMSEYLSEKGIKSVAMTSQSNHRGRGSNKHLAGFLRIDDVDDGDQDTTKSSTTVKDSAHVMITTSLLSRGLDFSPSIKHVFIVDEPRNMIDFLHRAGRSGRAGQRGKVVVFGKMTGRGSSRLADVRKRVGALVL